ncbi:hypothetical protein D9756_008169 [Leucocoprinus leucothites]|uniref:Extracellular metalloproteinase n=1 Tax=Leucocoprinus leucothites TaxID=201217 RepID=A0A8H5D052_9AGAR|nr:hypothetical protein D9756_008169 [Leucoagaricus leucothites]
MTSTSFRWLIVILEIASLNLLLDVRRVQAHPWPMHAKHATHRTRLYARGLKLEVYHPRSKFETYDNQFNNNTSATPQMAQIPSPPKTCSNNVHFDKGWSGKHGQYAYLRQFIGGIPVANAVANIVFGNSSQVIAFGSSFVQTEGVKAAPASPSKKWTEVLSNTEKALGGTYTSGDAPNLEYFVNSDGSLALTYVMQIKNETENLWVEAFVCAHSGELLSVTDFTAHATFNVVPIQKQNFFDGRESLENPEDLESSPNGWIAAPGSDSSFGLTRSAQHFSSQVHPSQPRLFSRISGNNAVMFVDSQLNVNSLDISSSREQSVASGVFNNAYDPDDPQSPEGLDATIDNAFYVMNTMHDIAYRYGFTENAGNFQIDNFGRGGAGQVQGNGDGDPLQISVRDTSDVNNAVFQTPPDGTPPVTRFFFFNLGGDVRDSAFANDVLIHEFTHGVTGRMTGGGSARCLQSLEAGGMGEGWSDMMAAWVGQTSETVGDFRIGTYFSREGIRSNPYSTDENVNPLKFSDAGKLNEVHAIGEVWANTLYNVFADLVAERGFSNAPFTAVEGQEGNVVFMHNMIDGLLFQPCNPTILQSRDAILAADRARYDGAHQCIMWRAFARKGMGVDADDQFKDGFDVPPECAV